MDGEDVDGGLVGPDEWARSVERRIAWFLAYFKNREPERQQVRGDLEHERALRIARPGRWPAHGFLTSPFGWRRDPFTRVLRFHSGLDIAGQLGQPVAAAADGVVVRAEWSSGFGNLVEVDHGFGISTLYGHNSKLLVHAGDRVVAGQELARMGSTGRSTGVHCHFEVHLDGEPVDPMPYLSN
jgi:murein DD-endopeptidase MepM/ murein hydrolase activator NlpD